MKKSVLIPYERWLCYQNKLDDVTPTTQLDATDAHQQTVSDSITEHAIGQSSNQPLTSEEILRHFSGRRSADAKLLLNYITSRSLLNWNANGELMQNDGERVYDSNITELIHDAVNDTSNEPIGCNEFYCAIRTVPIDLVKNERRRARLIGGKYLATTTAKPLKQDSVTSPALVLPPPGIPDTPPIPLSRPVVQDWKDLWKAF